MFFFRKKKRMKNKKPHGRFCLCTRLDQAGEAHRGFLYEQWMVQKKLTETKSMGKISCTRRMHENTYSCSSFSLSFNLLLAHHRTLLLLLSVVLFKCTRVNVFAVCRCWSMMIQVCVYWINEFMCALCWCLTHKHKQIYAKRISSKRTYILMFNVFWSKCGLIEFQHKCVK